MVTTLLPSRHCTGLRTALLDYLTTTFALADADARAALSSFLEHDADGIFKGPYVRTRLPFAPAAEGWQSALDVLPAGFVPYGHQAAAFARLASRDRRPLPTLVTTGTGSGKTEAFTLPILDHVLRARREGRTGLKALILYPMNALANDQAARLAAQISAEPTDGQVNPYAGITAALYTGEGGPKRTKVSADGLITAREVIRSTAPDILLTNYKMLDHLLLRADDAKLWAQSADSLQYVVLDEFHTYDGAQGTDVAMLLRRLGVTLKSYWPERGSDGDVHSDDEWERPLGRITPVGTSATLGDGGDAAAMVGFASEVFGEDFDDSCVVTESRVSLEDWLGGFREGGHQGFRRDVASPRSAQPAESAAQPAVNAAQPALGAAHLADGLEPATLSASLLAEVNADLARVEDGDELTRRLLTFLHTASDGADLAPLFEQASDEDLLRYAQGLPVVRDLIANTTKATSLDDLAAALLPADARDSDTDLGSAFVSFVVAALSHLRAVLGRGAVSVEVHLWIRELTRIDRLASSAASYVWGDDGSLLGATDSDAVDRLATGFPAIYCRHCGRSGWGVELATTGHQLSATDTGIRGNHLMKTGRFRALVHAPGEAHRAEQGDTVEGLHWFNTQARDITSNLPDGDDADYRHGRILPVLMVSGKDADDYSRDDVCPSCLQRDGIRFLGSAIATLLSVSLSTLFGAAGLDPAEKKALVFTDSVQDAAHRAGFIAARSHTLTMRSVMRDALGPDGDLNLSELATEVLRRAGDDPFRRYRLLPAEFISDEKMRPFWTADRLNAVPRDLRERVHRRLLFDLALEFGLVSRFGRTLETTGSVGVHVNVGSPGRMAAAARSVVTNDDTPVLDDEQMHADDATLTRWVRGVVEHMRAQGAIEHVWFERYLKSDGNRWFLTGGRPREGMTSFPKGRSHPAFPRVGGKKMRDPMLDSVTDTQSWYARWTARTLGISPQHGAKLARALLHRLAADLMLKAVLTDSGGTVYAIPAASVVVAATRDDDLTARRHQLVCDTCHAQETGGTEAIDQLDGAPCLYVRCPGHLERAAMQPGNFYRRLYASSDMRRIVAREHTGLLNSDVRLEYETGFKYGSDDPDSPNTLVATPTLEMGIDIGDLSAVFLASLPRTVASYLQRIGRAGRQTGNALNLAYVTGRGEFLPRLGDPTSLINGAVRPPSIYLSAEEILQRQYVAHLVDQFARDGVEHHHPRTAKVALEKSGAGSFLGDLIDDAETRSAEHLARFLGTFGAHLRRPAVDSLRAWATPADGAYTSGLAAQVFTASTRWTQQKELLEHRRAAIQQSLPGLMQAADLPAATDDDRRAVQTAQAALKLVNARLGDITGKYWIAAMEEFGLLPNYTLLGDSATLDVTISWYDPDKGSFDSQSTGVQRPTSQALREFAPGATFYAKGLEIEIDAVDLGTEAESIRTIAFCPDCGHAVDTELSGAAVPATACPRCGATGMQDTGQRVPVVELTRASAAIRRDEALIDDRRDDRSRTRFTIVTAADIDPDAVAQQWYVDGFGLGAKYLSRVTLRWLNLGRRATTATALEIAGESAPASRFRVCEACGHIDNSARSNSMDEHRPWCPHRKSHDEHARSIVLSRTLTTQGVIIPLPPSVTAADSFALPSLQAALLLGLRDQFGGSPDHIGVALVRDPNPDGPNAQALLLHDTVPGGTGYLADLASPDNLWRLLRSAYATVRDCRCAAEGRLACHRCLLPFAAPHEVDRVARQTAERHLRALLTAGVPDAPEPGEECAWQTTTKPPAASSFESPLEVRFRQAFTTMAEHLGATVKEEPGQWGNTSRLGLGSAQWTLRPQIQLQGVRPDFLLESSTPGPRIAIFVDGFGFHATPAHNRVKEDADKRAVLRLSGDKVLAVTAADLDAFEADAAQQPPTWVNPGYELGLRKLYGFSGHAWSASLGGPMALLAEWIQQHDTADLAKFAAAAPMSVPRTKELAVAERARLAEIAPALLDDPDSIGGDGDMNAWWWNQGAFGLLARRRLGEPLAAGVGPGIDVAVILDDRAVGTPGFRDDWQSWLTVSNMLAFRGPELVTDITAFTVDQSAAAPAPSTAAPRRVVVDIAWRDVLDALFPLPEGAEELITELAGRKLPKPDAVGDEDGELGIPLDLAWNERRIAVLLDPIDEDVKDLEDAGWRIIAPDADQVAAAMEEAGQ